MDQSIVIYIVLGFLALGSFCALLGYATFIRARLLDRRCKKAIDQIKYGDYRCLTKGKRRAQNLLDAIRHRLRQEIDDKRLDFITVLFLCRFDHIVWMIGYARERLFDSEQKEKALLRTAASCPAISYIIESTMYCKTCAWNEYMHRVLQRVRAEGYEELNLAKLAKALLSATTDRLIKKGEVRLIVSLFDGKVPEDILEQLRKTVRDTCMEENPLERLSLYEQDRDWDAIWALVQQLDDYKEDRGVADAITQSVMALHRHGQLDKGKQKSSSPSESSATPKA